MRTIKNILTHEDAQKGVVMKEIGKVFEQIGKEIAEMKDATIAREVAKKIGELLRDNGVVVNVTECTCDDVAETSFSRKYGVVITGLDFSEHDKPFEDAVSELGHTVSVLEGAIDTLRSRCTENARELFDRNCYGGLTIVCHSKEIEFENKQLKQSIAELESKCTEKKTEINLNDKIKVKLTPLGVEIYYHQYDELNKKIKANGGPQLEPKMPQIDKDGYTEFTLWEFMELYGEHIGMCKPNVILPLNIIISE